MSIIPLLLAFSIATAPIASPCAEQDTECLLRQTLRLSYDLEAAKEEAEADAVKPERVPDDLEAVRRSLRERGLLR